MIRARPALASVWTAPQRVDHPTEWRHFVEKYPRGDAEASVIEVVVPYGGIRAVVRRAARRAATPGRRRAIGRQDRPHDHVARLVVVHAAAHDEVAGEKEVPVPKMAVPIERAVIVGDRHAAECGRQSRANEKRFHG